MLPRAGGSIELYPFLKAHWNAMLPRLTHQFFDAVAVAASRDNQGIERLIGFEGFAYGMDAGETIHLGVSCSIQSGAEFENASANGFHGRKT